ncbi:MAG: polysaccharide biosynthesis protein [Lachnospiraceae bacterium]|nr:polysaccharide biosynthesis protein [Lachnospiraceae bacterium]
MNRRMVSLYIIDTVMLISVYGVLALSAVYGVSSIVANGEFTLIKMAALYVCVMSMRLLFKVYSNVWRYANTSTYLRLVFADLIAGALYIAVGRVVREVNIGAAYSIILVFTILLITLMSRLIYQYLYSKSAQRNDAGLNGVEGGIHKINIAIVGAGNVGASLADELIRNPLAHYIPYCFIDKDSQKVGKQINGIKVYYEDDSITEVIKSMPIQEIVIALPDATSEDKTKLYNLYKTTGCKVKLYDYPLGDGENNSTKRGVREFQIEDLLFRDSVSIKGELAHTYYTDKVVMVTGGGGSIGSELCRQIAKRKPRKLVIIDIYENNAYDIQQELINRYGDRLNLEVYIASVRDFKRLEEIFRKTKPQIVFHAAAHKHVPLMENSACEAIKNNVLGTYNVANLSEQYNVEKFLLISTDKAVNPTNIMGASKRICEMVIQCRKDSKTDFTAVRFGNVLGSNGSVIPLFKKQIESGGPITLTDKRIIRYFMTIPEAVGLVMETCAMAKNGELFVLDMGKPVKILDLAENMIQLSGLKPYEDIDIVEVGLRPGEKLYEELLMKTEELDKTENEMIFIERDKPLSRDEVDNKLAILLQAVEEEGYNVIVQAIKDTVPTYHSPEEVNKRAEESKEMALAFSEVAVATE